MGEPDPCACKHDGKVWHMCPTHKAEFLERHLRAQAEKDAAELLGSYYLVPTRDQPNLE